MAESKELSTAVVAQPKLPDLPTSLLERRIHNLPRIKKTAARLASEKAPVLPPGQAWGLIAVAVGDDPINDPGDVAFNFLGAFCSEKEAKEHAVELNKHGWTNFQLYPIRLGRWGNFPPPNDMPRTYANPKLEQIMSSHVKNVEQACEMLEERMQQSKRDEEAAFAKMVERQNSFHERRRVAMLEQGKTEEEFLAEDKIYNEEMLRIQEDAKNEQVKVQQMLDGKSLQELELEAKTEAKAEPKAIMPPPTEDDKSGGGVLSKVDASKTPDHGLDLSADHKREMDEFARVIREQGLKHDLDFAKKRARNPAHMPSKEDIRPIKTKFGTVNYMPGLKQMVNDEEMLKTNNKLKSLGFPSLLRYHMGETIYGKNPHLP